MSPVARGVGIALLAGGITSILGGGGTFYFYYRNDQTADALYQNYSDADADYQTHWDNFSAADVAWAVLPCPDGVGVSVSLGY